MFKFIHAADIHLDSPLKGLEQYEGAPVEEIRGATRRALENLIELAIDEKVEFVLISGDLYDGNWRDFNTGLYFVGQVRRLREAGIPLYLIAGNHDAANKMTRALPLPENVTFFPHASPETAIIEDLGVAIHGQSYEKAAVFEDLSANYPKARAGLFNIGLLHTSATGREGHENYAPCSLEGLQLKGYDYWALGHVHTRETLAEDPFVAFSGNIQGRQIRETGPKGCLLVEVGDDYSLTADFRPLDVVRWERAVVDVAETRSVDEILERTSREIGDRHADNSDRLLALRVELVGSTAAHQELSAKRHLWMEEIRSLANDVGGGDVWVEKVKIETDAPATDLHRDQLPDSAIGELTTLFQELRDDVTKLKDVDFDFSDVMKKLPGELRDEAKMSDPEWLRSVISEAESRLISQLLESDEA